MRQIDDKLYLEVLNILEKRNKTIYKKFLILDEVKKDSTLARARDTKTKNKINEIREAIREIAEDKNKKPTKYDIHKKTNIAYQTINKYYEDLIKDF